MDLQDGEEGRVSKLCNSLVASEMLDTMVCVPASLQLII